MRASSRLTTQFVRELPLTSQKNTDIRKAYVSIRVWGVMLSIALSLTCKWKYRRRERVELGRVLYVCLPSGERMLVEGGEGVDGVLLEPSSLSKREERS